MSGDRGKATAQGQSPSFNHAPWRRVLAHGAFTLSCLVGLAPSLHAAPAASTLDSVLDKGVLKVCTSGDYRPFTYSADGTHFEGADIDMANALAASLNVHVQWVQTAWRDLAANIVAQRCDIGMGGISVSLERQRQAAFSAPYLADGKTAISRCEDAARFTDLAAIDQAGVRVIVNPGGTNQRFVTSHIEHATITTFPDNATIFEEIAEHRADVMVTDASEVHQQVKRHPGVLCPVAATVPFLFGEKAYILPRGDPAWADYVNQWLHIQKASGAFAAVSARWLD